MTDLITISLLCVSAAASPSLHVQPTAVKPGDPVVVTVLNADRPPEGKLGERPLHFYAVEGGYEALSGLPVEAEPGQVSVEIALPGPDAGEPQQLSEKLEVADPHFPTRELTVAKDFVEPPPAVRKRIKADQRAFREAYGQPFQPRLFQGEFILPRDAKTTAPFGDLRTFNGKKQSQHYGLDLDGRVGDPIQAAQAGKVVLVRECYASGNTVLIHHGGGLYTAYFHMSEFAVHAGEVVKQGQRLGKVGRTGRVTGPHLHWAVKIDGLYVDPRALLKLPFSAAVQAPDKAEPEALSEEPE